MMRFKTPSLWNPLKKKCRRLLTAPKKITTTLGSLKSRFIYVISLIHIIEERSRTIEHTVHQHKNLVGTLEYIIQTRSLTTEDLVRLSHQFKRNCLPNDDAATQKNLIMNWKNNRSNKIGYKELLESGFRTYSQNDEDGILLRIFSQIESTNKCVIEIGSNCDGSDIEIPENLSANLIINHGWCGTIFEMDAVECGKMQYFFARHLSTKHFHWFRNGNNEYYSPRIIQQAVEAENINSIIPHKLTEIDPDLMIVDIDGGDYAVVQALNIIRPRVLVVEFEKRFRDRFSVAQFNKEDFSKRWQQSGSVSLPAWEKLLGNRGYILCTINTTGFNAFFIRADVASDKIAPLQSKDAFDLHPIFGNIEDDFWLTPDDTWQEV